MEYKQNWYFTFGFGQKYQNCYYVIHGTYESARQKMFNTFGNKWSMQYGSANEAGVEKYKLVEIK